MDGEKTDVYNVNNGCVGVRVHEGRHEIRLCYTVKGFNEGIAITAVSSGILILYAAVCGIRRKMVRLRFKCRRRKDNENGCRIAVYGIRFYAEGRIF